MAPAIETESQTRVGVNRLAKYGLLAVLVAVAPVMYVVAAVAIIGVLTRVPSTAAEGTA